ncbi:MAG TPA: methionine synthase [Armatimonadetes bacterium]|nr:methionine synthase [Armatimonadota bacterium]
MSRLSKLLQRHCHPVADGAWGTELAKRGLSIGEVPEMWNLNRSGEVASVARSYVEAGADIILTNTFGGSRLKLAKAGLADRCAALNRAGVEISKQAAGDRVVVLASIGPTGEFMQPLGLVSEQEMVDCFAEQVQALAEGGADGFVIETMSDLGEAIAALRAVRENCGLPAVVSMTFEQGPAGYATIMGVKPPHAATALSEAGADVVGANCGCGIDVMIGVIGEMAQATSLPLWAKPNAGLPQLVAGQTVFRETPEQMAANVPALIDAGARIVGGCCGTAPDHIRTIATVIRGAD